MPNKNTKSYKLLHNNDFDQRNKDHLKIRKSYLILYYYLFKTKFKFKVLNRKYKNQS